MKRMVIEASIANQTLETSARTPDLSYLLRGLAITRPNQVWPWI